jgi:predicted transcriptional regulator
MNENSRRPTEAELAILRVIWDQGPSTVREVLEVMNRGKRTGYTTVLKLLQIMTEKGLVERDESQRSHIYQTRDPMEVTQRRLVQDLLDRAFGGAADKLVLQALTLDETTRADLAEVRHLLKETDEASA